MKQAEQKDLDALLMDLLYEEENGATLDPELRKELAERYGDTIDAYQEIRAAYRTLPEEDPAPQVSAQLLRAASSTVESARSGFLDRFLAMFRSPSMGLAGVGAAAVLVVGVSVFVLERGGEEAMYGEAELGDPVRGLPEAEERTVAAADTVGDEDGDDGWAGNVDAEDSRGERGREARLEGRYGSGVAGPAVAAAPAPATSAPKVALGMFDKPPAGGDVGIKPGRHTIVIEEGAASGAGARAKPTDSFEGTGKMEAKKSGAIGLGGAVAARTAVLKAGKESKDISIDGRADEIAAGPMAGESVGGYEADRISVVETEPPPAPAPATPAAEPPRYAAKPPPPAGKRKASSKYRSIGTSSESTAPSIALVPKMSKSRKAKRKPVATPAPDLGRDPLSGTDDFADTDSVRGRRGLDPVDIRAGLADISEANRLLEEKKYAPAAAAAKRAFDMFPVGDANRARAAFLLGKASAALKRCGTTKSMIGHVGGSAKTDLRLTAASCYEAARSWDVAITLNEAVKKEDPKFAETAGAAIARLEGKRRAAEMEFATRKKKAPSKKSSKKSKKKSSKKSKKKSKKTPTDDAAAF